jgi:hypothetical protein
MMTHPELIDLMKSHGYTVNSFSEEMGVSRWTVYQWGGLYGVPHWVRIHFKMLDKIRRLEGGVSRGESDDRS